MVETNDHAFVGNKNRFAGLISNDPGRYQSVELGAYLRMTEKTNWHGENDWSLPG